MIKAIIPRFSIIVLLAAFMVPVMASAQDYILDTGTPPGGTSQFLLNTANWYAAEFSATAGETISQFSAYLAPNGGNGANNSFNFILYGSGLVGARSPSSLITVAGTFGGTTGWSSASASYTFTSTGDYWLAVEEGTRGTVFDVPEETTTTTGTVPALGFAYSTSGAFNTTQAVPIGLEVSVVPEPTTYGILAGVGLLGVSLRGQFRRKQA